MALDRQSRADPNVQTPIAVFVHVHYPDVWEEMAIWIERAIARPFHLVLTTSEEGNNLPIPGGTFLVSQRVITCTNRGRDIRPFLRALRAPIDYEIGLKLHTKRSAHRLDGADWGRMLVQSLLPDRRTTDQIVEQMSRDRRLVMVAPDGMLVSLDRWMQGNREPMNRTAERLGLDISMTGHQTPVFCAGSMFWFRREAFALLEASDLDPLFEEEVGQVDGTTAHALERLFAPIAEKSGGVITTMKGVVMSDTGMPSDHLRSLSRQLADQPNAFLRPLPRLIRWVFTIPGVRALYRAVPVSWRRLIRRWFRP
ncbi:MAG TPA: hypothetical protein ENH55_04180 [Aurantimonas coralicida]|uniref:Rhamnan synthesis protein F n=2 Tax=root TaxID=1 RepID=A0A9C9NK68_9HYPH|nr:hypothetical protein [Aurantimonas coralicida]HEU03059.1 hypothetical protein [Aurantimonas coralicida]